MHSLQISKNKLLDPSEPARREIKPDKTIRTLYLCYFGLREPLVQTQVLPYLRQLSRAGVDVSLLTFESDLSAKWPMSERERWDDLLKKDGIEWAALAYHKRPSIPATLYDIFAGAYHCARQIQKRKIDVLHARSHMPLAMALLAKLIAGCKLVFDVRGLMADEYVDAGMWKQGSLVFRAVKRLERIGLRQADQIVVLTRRMRDWLIENKLATENNIEVIPCCADFSKYADEVRENSDPKSDRFEVIYAGSVTGLYLLDEMARFFLILRKNKEGAFLRVLTTSAASEIAARLQTMGIAKEDFWVGAVNPSEVPAYLRRARLGISFRKPTFSQIAASPTKIPEYLAAGLPVVCNSGIGDVDELVTKERVGVIIKDFTENDYLEALPQLDKILIRPGLSNHCRKVAQKHFDLLKVGGAKYHKLYQRLLLRL